MLSTSLQRLVAIYSNEMRNVKTRFETLYKVKLENIVLKDSKQSTLEDMILDQKYKDTPLFLAIE